MNKYRSALRRMPQWMKPDSDDVLVISMSLILLAVPVSIVITNGALS